METNSKAPREKRRNHERRKEKSRDAARCRRSRETEIFTDLATSLPLSNEQVAQLDKASIMRLAISYLKVREMISLVPNLPDPDGKNSTDGSVFLKSLDGFIVVLSVDGDFIYLSDNVCDYLGLSQIDLMGQNIFDYSHPCDHEEIRETISGKTKEGDEGPRSLFIRMKCTLTSKGRSVNLKSAIYKVIQCKGRMIKHPNIDENCNDEGDEKGGLRSCFMAVGQPIPHPSNIETPLSKETFLTKHSLDMKFTHADDDLLQDLLGYDADDLVGKSVYEYHHALDSEAILSSCKCLFSKGQCETPRYRFLAKTGGYVWVVTQATLIYDKVQKPQSVVCVNYVVSGWECTDEICSAGQYDSSVKAEATARAAAEPDAELEEQLSVPTTEVELGELEEGEEAPPHSPQKPKNATCEIFGPRTKDMSKGFLTFSEEDSGLTMLKEEPDDLTHLAPTAGDVCIPLDEQHPYLSDMLEDIFLPDGFNTLLVDGPSDPFISYRDYQNASPQLLSPNLSKQSDCSLPSLNSPSDSCIDEEQMSTFMNLQMNEDTTEMALKAPFIHTILNDDRPTLVSNDLMWSDGERKKTENSSLAQLLCNSKINKVNDSGSDEEFYSDKTCRTSWPEIQRPAKQARVQGSKRPSCASYDASAKRPRSEPKENLSSELLHQLMSNSGHRGRDKDKSGWKAACVSQPSDSVLMNLLDDRLGPLPERRPSARDRRRLMRRASIGLLDPDGGSIASLLDLTQLDYEVNAPAGFGLLQGQDLLSALDVSAGI